MAARIVLSAVVNHLEVPRRALSILLVPLPFFVTIDAAESSGTTVSFLRETRERAKNPTTSQKSCEDDIRNYSNGLFQTM